MFASDFQAKLRKLNPKLRIFCGDDESKPAGIYRVVNGEYEVLCGVDKHFLPEHPIVDEMGHYTKGGWRRAIRALIDLKVVDRRKADRVFGTQIVGVRKPNVDRVYQDPIEKELQAAYVRNMAATGKPALKREEIMDLASEISKCK